MGRAEHKRRTTWFNRRRSRHKRRAVSGTGNRYTIALMIIKALYLVWKITEMAAEIIKGVFEAK